ncbi:Protein ANTHESIS POMOTING FACTOR 1, partial [Bienertia sinuspersici]
MFVAASSVLTFWIPNNGKITGESNAKDADAAVKIEGVGGGVSFKLLVVVHWMIQDGSKGGVGGELVKVANRRSWWRGIIGGWREKGGGGRLVGRGYGGVFSDGGWREKGRGMLMGGNCG